MELKHHFHIEIEKDDNKFVFSMPAGCPIGAAYDAAFDVLQHVSKLAQETAEKMKRQDENDKEGNGQE